MNLRERNHKPGRVFTYIDADPYEFYDEVILFTNFMFCLFFGLFAINIFFCFLACFVNLH